MQVTVPSSLSRSSAAESRRLLTWIAIYKLFKAIAMLAGGIAARHLLHHDLTTVVLRWVHELNLDPNGRMVNWALSHVLSVNDRKLRLLGYGFFIYAIVYTAEGVGLYLEKRWAEWLTAAQTSLLVPLEIWEMCRRPGLIKAVVIVLNVALVVYLVWRLLRDQHRLNLLAGAETPLRDSVQDRVDGKP